LSCNKSILNLWVSTKPITQRPSIGLNRNKTEDQFHDGSLEIIITASQKNAWQSGTEKEDNTVYGSLHLNFYVYMSPFNVIISKNTFLLCAMVLTIAAHKEILVSFHFLPQEIGRPQEASG
jgi:hypothetical protein